MTNSTLVPMEQSVVHDVEPIVVRASVQFIINSSGATSMQVQSFMQSATEQIITAIDKHKHQNVIPIQEYAKTAHAAAYIDVDASFLTQRAGNVFKEGTHYFKPADSKILRWNLNALEEWMRRPSDKESYDAILDKMFS